MSEIKKYQGKTVEAVQITEENLNEVADWCDGKVVENRYAENEGQHPLILLVRVGFGKGLSAPAEIGSWLVKNHQGIFKIFQDRAFGQVFEGIEDREEAHVLRDVQMLSVGVELSPDPLDDSPKMDAVSTEPTA